MFQHTAARRRLQLLLFDRNILFLFQHTAARRRLAQILAYRIYFSSFNTQPPEGGCRSGHRSCRDLPSFNTQPPEGGWPDAVLYRIDALVSTHSRPKAAEPLSKALLHQVSQPQFR